eukprot:5646597-Amphidinium_carterae.1
MDGGGKGEGYLSETKGNSSDAHSSYDVVGGIGVSSTAQGFEICAGVVTLGKIEHSQRLCLCKPPFRSVCWSCLGLP